MKLWAIVQLSVWASLVYAAPESGKTPLLKPKLAILGDSISTAALSYESFRWDAAHIDAAFTANKRSWPKWESYSKRFQDAFPEAERKIIEAPGRAYSPTMMLIRLITPTIEGYLVGRSQGFAATEVGVAAEVGNYSGQAAAQVQQLLLVTGNKAPQQLFVFFTGNDLCRNGFGADKEEKAYEKEMVEEYSENLMKAIRLFIDKAELPKDGTDIFVLNHLDISQLVDKTILNKKVHAFGEKEAMSCREFRFFETKKKIADEVKNPLLKQVVSLAAKGTTTLPPGKNLCPRILNVTPPEGDITNEKYLKQVAQVKAASLVYQKATEATVEKAKSYLSDLDDKGVKKDVRVHHLESPSDLQFDEDEVANDCFHLSLKGQEKVADTVLAEMRRRKLLVEK
ncbi:MAG: hypothetical protein R3B54_15965 [Bdellovibrionota bacterium]